MTKKILGEWNTRTIVGVAIGVALFGVLMVYGGVKVFTNTSLTSAYVVVAVVAVLFGPVPAAITAGLGNVLADLIGGWGFWFDWSAGNLVLGFLTGLGCVVGGANVKEGKFDAKNAIIYAVFVLLGCGLAFGVVTPILTYLFYSSELTITWGQATAAIISDGIVLLVIGIPLLFALASRNKRKYNLTKE